MSEDLQQSTVAPQPTGPQLTIQDLALALQTIQVTAQRGAIRADEMSAVGTLHDKIFAFLKASGAFDAPATTPALATTDAPESADSAESTPGETDNGTESSN